MAILDNSDKLTDRRKLISRSYDLYEGIPNDPISSAQDSLFPPGPEATNGVNSNAAATTDANVATPSREKPQFNFAVTRLGDGLETTPRSSVAGSPAPEGGSSTPVPFVFGTNTPSGAATAPQNDPSELKLLAAEHRDAQLPVSALDTAILASVAHAARGDERKTRDFLGGIMVVGGGSKTPAFHSFLEQRLRELRPGFAKEIMVGSPPREMDGQVVVWKGASVFGKLGATAESWIRGLEFDRLGSRVLAYKCMWNW
jgi:actin-related protein 8